jgi:8-oxo-dGTP pyrophosphatase MutT (NUDIX family)
VRPKLDAILHNADIERLGDALRAEPGKAVPPQGSERLAAIAVIFRAGPGGDPELLLIKRADHAGDPWSGHIACPGGRAEPVDRSLEDTAVRETKEEIGVDLRKHGLILGTLDDVAPRISALPPLVIRPFVAVVEADARIVANGEVAGVFWVPLSALREPASWGQGTVNIRGTPTDVAVFHHSEHTVWGLTERVLRDLMRRVG